MLLIFFKLKSLIVDSDELLQTHGGDICEDEQQANVILVDEEADIEHIRRRYYRSNILWQQRVFVENRDFVLRCIRMGKYEHIRPSRKGMPGSEGGRVYVISYSVFLSRFFANVLIRRIPYTQEDDEHLAFYIASVIPDAADGGRSGHLLYKTLTEELVRDCILNIWILISINTPSKALEPEYVWAKRHTWQSWRERYKMNIPRFDPKIAAYAARLKNVAHGFGHDPRSRRYSRGRLIRRAQHMEEEEEEEEEENERQAVDGARPEDLDNRVPDGVPQVHEEVQGIENGISDDGHGSVERQLRRRRRDDPATSQHENFPGESPKKRQRVASPAAPSEPRTSTMEKRQRASGHSRPSRNSNENGRRPAQGALDDAISFDIDQIPE